MVSQVQEETEIKQVDVEKVLKIIEDEINEDTEEGNLTGLLLGLLVGLGVLTSVVSPTPHTKSKFLLSLPRLEYLCMPGTPGLGSLAEQDTASGIIPSTFHPGTIHTPGWYQSQR